MILKGKEQTADQLGTSDPKEQPSVFFLPYVFGTWSWEAGNSETTTDTAPPKKNPQENHIFYSKEGKGQPD